MFIDEVDAVARARGKGMFGGANDEREVGRSYWVHFFLADHLICSFSFFVSFLIINRVIHDFLEVEYIESIAGGDGWIF